MSKNKSTTNPAQMSIFDYQQEDKRPLPELIASGGTDWAIFPLAYVDVNSVRYYAIQDWIAGISQTEYPRKVWDKLKKRYPELSPAWRQLPYIATNGRSYQMDHTDADGLYMIVQRMDTNTGIRDHILAYLAKAGVKLDEVRRDSNRVADLVGAGKAIDAGLTKYKENGKDDLWMQARYIGKINRHYFTDAINAALGTPSSRVYKEATDSVYVGVWERTSVQLRADLGVEKGDSLRDHFPLLALSYTGIAESLIADELGSSHDLTWDQALRIIKSVARVIREQIDMINQIKGTDMMTGRKLIDKARK